MLFFLLEQNLLMAAKKLTRQVLLICLFLSLPAWLHAQYKRASFNVIAFYSSKNDAAHISFVREANKWFSKAAKEQNFSYDSTNDWSKMNASFLSRYQVVIFLDSRPEDSLQRDSFEKYINSGGAWMGFHFAAFALNGSAYPQNWDWYHEHFLGSPFFDGTGYLRLNDAKPLPKRIVLIHIPARCAMQQMNLMQ